MQYYDPWFVDFLIEHGHPKLAEHYKENQDKNMGFKRCGDCIVGLSLPDAKEDTNLHRCDVMDRRFAKFRARFVVVVFIYNQIAKEFISQKHHIFYPIDSWKTPTPIVYEVGTCAFPDSYDPNLRKVCSHGIHFFLSLQAAVCYNNNDPGAFGWHRNGKKRRHTLPIVELLWHLGDNFQKPIPNLYDWKKFIEPTIAPKQVPLIHDSVCSRECK